MHRVPLRRSLERKRHSQGRHLVVDTSCKHDRHRQIVHKAARQHNRRMSGQIRHQQTGASRRRTNKHIPLRHQLLHLMHQQRACTLRAQILNRRNKSRSAKRVRPIIRRLSRKLVDAPIARDVVKRRRRFRRQDKPQRADRELSATRSASVSRLLFPTLRAPFCRSHGVVQPASAVARSAVESWTIKLGLEITDAQRADVCIRVPIERRVADGDVFAVWSIDRVQRGRAVFNAATNRTNLVHGPTQTHRPVATNSAISRPQSSDTAA